MEDAYDFAGVSLNAILEDLYSKNQDLNLSFVLEEARDLGFTVSVMTTLQDEVLQITKAGGTTPTAAFDLAVRRSWVQIEKAKEAQAAQEAAIQQIFGPGTDEED